MFRTTPKKQIYDSFHCIKHPEQTLDHAHYLNTLLAIMSTQAGPSQLTSRNTIVPLRRFLDDLWAGTSSVKGQAPIFPSKPASGKGFPTAVKNMIWKQNKYSLLSKMFSDIHKKAIDKYNN